MLNDEECIYKCVHEECYYDILDEYELFVEYGEINNDFKKEMERCYNSDNDLITGKKKKKRKNGRRSKKK